MVPGVVEVSFAEFWLKGVAVAVGSTELLGLLVGKDVSGVIEPF